MESIQHFSHSKHPLILINKVDEKEEEFVCYGCQKPFAEKGNYYACQESPECSFYLHKKCADLPREINLPAHIHPLILFPCPPYGEGLSCSCDICQCEGFKWFIYNCSLCEFDVDILCASILLQEKEGNIILEHEGHPQHPLTIQLRPSLFKCDACLTEEKDLSYFCSTCQFWIHKSCASLPKSITVSHHDDPLFLAYSIPPKYRTFEQYCDICGEKVHPSKWFYYCDNCRYFNHLKCATATATSNTPSLIAGNESEIQDEEGDKESDDQLMRFPLFNHECPDTVSLFVANNIKTGAYDNGATDQLRHRFHNHPLSIHNDADSTNNNVAYNEILCNGCVRPISVPFYSCSECNFFLHRFYAQLPQNLNCPRDPGHSIEVFKFKNCYGYIMCSFCSQRCSGFFCRCVPCGLQLDIGCASYLLPSRIKHDSHGHPLVRRHLPEGEQKLKCNACSRRTKGSDSFSCKACSFNVCVTCVNHHGSVRHEYDRHPIPLTYPPIKDHPSDFICEKDINPRDWMYHCHDCNQSFHTKCITSTSPGEFYSNVKFGGTVNFENIHQHPLTFVRHNKSKYESVCNQCKSNRTDKPVLECAPCRFKLCLPCARKIDNII